MKIFKRAISILLTTLTLVSVVTSLPFTAGAAEITETKTNASDAVTKTETDDLEISGTNSLGNMLAAEYSESDAEAEESINKIYEIEVKDNTAYVDLRTYVDAILVVALYDDEGLKMYTSARSEITTENSSVELTFDIETMPEYYLIKAYLLDSTTYKPVSNFFECDTYTQEMQEFLSKTVEDFDEEKVLNLDDENDNNFLVYNEDVILTSDTNETNIVSSVDSENGVYVIENIDESITSLNVGDIFSHTYEDENLLIVKITSIEINGTTATITGEELELADVFDYIKIDTTECDAETTIDNSNLEDGVEYIGSEDDSSVGTTFDNEGELELKGEYGIEKETQKFKVSGTVSAAFSASFKCYFDVKWLKIKTVFTELKFDIEIEILAKLEIDIKEKKIALGSFGFSPIPGVYIDFTPSIVFEGKVNVELKGVYTDQVGKKYDNGEWSNSCKDGHFETEFKVEGELFFGISFEPRVKILKSVCVIEMEAKTGVCLTAKLAYSASTEKNLEEIHNCTSCLEGNITFKLELETKIKFLNIKKLTFKSTFTPLEIKISDFYYSFDTKKFAFTTCPNNAYRQKITVIDSDSKPVKDATVTVESSTTDNKEYKTDRKGKAVIYLNKGTYWILVSKDASTQRKYVKVNGANTITINLPDESNTSNSGSSSNNSGSSSNNTNNSVIESVQTLVVSSGKCGDNVYYNFYDNGDLKIYGTGEMYNYSYNNMPWYTYRESIKDVTIESNVTSIGNDAFYDCSSLTSVIIPNSVTSIGDYAFYDCSSLTSVTIPDSVTSIGSSAFKNCKSLTSITIPNSVTSIGWYAFNATGYYKNINNWEDNVLYIDSCLIRAESPIRKCSIKNGTTIIANSAFEDCDSLTNVTIPNSVTSIGNSAFSSCYSLTSITIPNSVTSIGNSAFSSCYSLTSITIPDSVTGIGNSAFSSCYSLTSITIPDSVTSISYDSFYACIKLIEINVSNDNKTYSSSGGVLFNKTKTELIWFPEGKGNEYIIPNSVTSIGSYAFYNCNSLTNVTIPNSVTSIGRYAFDSCDNLTNVTIPNSVTSIGSYAFGSCNNLTNVTIPNSVTSIGSHAFYDCNSLTNVTILDGVTSIGSSAFRECSGLKSVTIPNSVTSIGDSAFNHCYSLTSVTILNSVISMHDFVFYECWSLKDVYYTGSEEQWKQLRIATNAIGWFSTAPTIHYNCTEANAAQVSSYAQSLVKDIEAIGTKNVETVGADAIKTFTKTNLEAGTEAVLIIFEGLTEEIDVLTTPILYIAQATADETGTATFSAYCDLDNKYWTACVYGYCSHSSTHTEIVNEATRGCDGLEITVCDHCGEIIESTVIPKTGVLGDVNGDGDVTADDVTLIQKYLAYIIDFSEDEMNLADTDQDGEVTIDDATRIQKYIAQLITEL